MGKPFNDVISLSKALLLYCTKMNNLRPNQVNGDYYPGRAKICCMQ